MFQSLNPEEFTQNPFARPDNWALAGASYRGASNAMTISWGLFGVLWEQNTVMIAVRPQRHTDSLLKAAECFSVSFFSPQYHSTLEYMGIASGKNEDKITQSGLAMHLEDGVPIFEEAGLILICRKLYTGRLEEAGFIEKEILNRFYPEKDFHNIYIGEAQRILQK